MITVLGGEGFVGRHLVDRLRHDGVPVQVPARGDNLPRRLGTVIDCVGVTGDFRSRPFDTIEAHVARLIPLLQRPDVDRFVYLSSTRVYRRATDTCESATIPVDPRDPDDLYDLSKLAGEALVLRADPRHRVARLSNVVGHDPDAGTFLPMLVRDAVQGRVYLGQALDSAKDYVQVEDVVEALVRVAERAVDRVYNVASGQCTTHGAIVGRLRELTGCVVDVAPDAPSVRQPPVDVSRARRDLGFAPRPVLDRLPALVDAARSAPPSRRIS